MQQQIVMAPAPAQSGQMQENGIYQFISVALELHWYRSTEFYSTELE